MITCTVIRSMDITCIHGRVLDARAAYKMLVTSDVDDIEQRRASRPKLPDSGDGNDNRGIHCRSAINRGSRRDCDTMSHMKSAARV